MTSPLRIGCRGSVTRQGIEYAVRTAAVAGPEGSRPRSSLACLALGAHGQVATIDGEERHVDVLERVVLGEAVGVPGVEDAYTVYLDDVAHMAIPGWVRLEAEAAAAQVVRRQRLVADSSQLAAISRGDQLVRSVAQLLRDRTRPDDLGLGARQPVDVRQGEVVGVGVGDEQQIGGSAIVDHHRVEVQVDVLALDPEAGWHEVLVVDQPDHVQLDRAGGGEADGVGELDGGGGASRRVLGSMENTVHPWVRRTATISEVDEDIVVSARVMAFSPTSSSASRLGYETVPELRYPHDFAVGPDGYFYVTTEEDPMIQVWDVAAETMVTAFGGLPDLDQPVGIAFGPDGLIYVASFWTRSIERYDAATLEHVDRFIAPVGIEVYEHWDDEGVPPTRIAFGPDGLLYVGTSQYGILRYDPADGSYVDELVQGHVEDWPYGPDDGDPKPGFLRMPRGFHWMVGAEQL